jgi:hypothetical protein
MKQNGTQIMAYAGEVNLLGERVHSTKTHAKGQKSLQMQQTRNTFTGLNNLPNYGRKLQIISFQISDQNSVWIPQFLFCPVKRKYIPKLNLTKPYEENKNAFSHWTNNILNPHPSLYFFPPLAQQPLEDDSLLIIQASRSHSDTPHSVALPWTSDHPTAETST